MNNLLVCFSQLFESFAMLLKDDGVVFSGLDKGLLEFFCICQAFAQLHFKSLFLPQKLLQSRLQLRQTIP
jgi:hypothetical protein